MQYTGQLTILDALPWPKLRVSPFRAERVLVAGMREDFYSQPMGSIKAEIDRHFESFDAMQGPLERNGG